MTTTIQPSLTVKLKSFVFCFRLYSETKGYVLYNLEYYKNECAWFKCFSHFKLYADHQISTFKLGIGPLTLKMLTYHVIKSLYS